ncbi:hypothetical protein [Turicimonas muris]|uniref:hypothetical protein n=1 Tax=Turicimonas muris TaxID=1796652 RepID=UPI00249483C5|nr:hypothetical protein [Turicimonas muris]
MYPQGCSGRILEEFAVRDTLIRQRIFSHMDKGGKQMHFLSAMDGQSAPDFAAPKKLFID